MLKQLKNFGAKVAAGVALATVSVASFAQSASNPITEMLDQIDLGGVAAAVTATGVLIVGIAMAFKAPDVAKRAVRKV